MLLCLRHDNGIERLESKGTKKGTPEEIESKQVCTAENHLIEEVDIELNKGGNGGRAYWEQEIHEAENAMLTCHIPIPTRKEARTRCSALKLEPRHSEVRLMPRGASSKSLLVSEWRKLLPNKKMYFHSLRLHDESAFAFFMLPG